MITIGCFTMEWIPIEKTSPPYGIDVLVLKTYLDCEYTQKGYHPDKSFWTKPVTQIDSFYSDNQWHNGGKATHWMNLPEFPDGLD